MVFFWPFWAEGVNCGYSSGTLAATMYDIFGSNTTQTTDEEQPEGSTYMPLVAVSAICALAVALVVHQHRAATKRSVFTF
jgi:hypothetical protein